VTVVATVRPFHEQDAAALTALYKSAVLKRGVRDYTAEQVLAWSSLAPTVSAWQSCYGDGRHALVATGAGGDVLAFGDLEANGHIGYLYASPEEAARGSADAIYQGLEAYGREAGMSRLYVEASEAARRFLMARGFKVMKRNDLEIGGVRIHNYDMEKQLT
jgi:putative acetyltransferase